jgi:hypothetical protein
VEFLNEHLDTIEVLAVEIPQYASNDASGLKALVPRLVGQTERARATKELSQGAPRRATPWTAEEVLGDIDLRTPEAGSIARRVIEWARSKPEITTHGGRRAHYPGVILAVHTNLSHHSVRGVLSLYGGDPPTLVIGLIRMIETAPYHRVEMKGQLLNELKRLNIPRLSGGPELLQGRPNIPLNQLNKDSLDGLLSIVSDWIDRVRAAAQEDVAEDGLEEE